MKVSRKHLLPIAKIPLILSKNVQFCSVLLSIFRYIKVLPDFESLVKLEASNGMEGARSKVVLVTGACLDYGPSRNLFAAWASNPSALLLLTQEHYKNESLAKLVLEKAEQSKSIDAKGRPTPQPFPLQFKVRNAILAFYYTLFQGQSRRNIDRRGVGTVAG